MQETLKLMSRLSQEQKPDLLLSPFLIMDDNSIRIKKYKFRFLFDSFDLAIQKPKTVSKTIKDQFKVMQKDFLNSCQEIPEHEEQSSSLLVFDSFLMFEEEFIMRDSAGSGQMSCSGEFIFKCSLNQTLWGHRDCLSSELSFQENSQEQFMLAPDCPPKLPSTNALDSQKREIQTEFKPIQRQEISPQNKENFDASSVPSTRIIKKRSKGMPTLSRRKKSKKMGKEKRDNNYVMKRAHTVLKKCCWAHDNSLRETTRIDSDGSMDYFIRLLCRLEEQGYLHHVIQLFKEEANSEISRLQAEIGQEANLSEIKHLKNVIAVLLKGKQAANIFEGGERVRAMEIMYGKGLTLKKVYKMDRAIKKLHQLVQEKRLGFCKTEAIPDILGMM